MAEDKQLVKVRQPGSGRAGLSPDHWLEKPALPLPLTCGPPGHAMLLLQQLRVEQATALTPTPHPQFPDVPPRHHPQLTPLQKTQTGQLDLPLWEGCGPSLWGPISSKLGKSPCDT